MRMRDSDHALSRLRTYSKYAPLRSCPSNAKALLDVCSGADTKR